MNKCPSCIFHDNGECHLNPPIAWDDMACPKKGMYTMVSESDWCGQWQAQAEVTEDITTVNHMGIPEIPKPRGRPKGS